MISRQFGHIKFLFLVLLSTGLSLKGQISFEEVAHEYKVQHKFNGNTIGGGISLFDFNKDGLDDLTLSSYSGQQLSFFINNGSGFDRIDPLVENIETVKQINWVDYDNDGDPDLYVAANDGINRLYQNLGDLELIDVTETSGLPLNVHFGYGACWGDYDRDGWLDLYYVSKGIIGDPDAIRSYNRLFKNNSDGTFKERTFEANASDDGKLPFCAAFLDYNNDMWPDIYIANDKLTFNTLLENTGRGTFIDVSEPTGANARMNAMCVNPGDYNHDGWMDIYITNTPIGSQFLKNTGEVNEAGYIQLENIAEEIGISFEGGNCWGSNFLDADNDGDLDLYVSSSIPSPKESSSAFFENTNMGSFRTPYIEGFQKDTSSSYSNAIGDVNNDGNIDIVVQNNPPHDFFIWENQTDNPNHWLKIHLEGIMSNRDGVGARIETYTGDLYQMQFTLCGSGFLGQNSTYRHIGLGNALTVDSIVITWPTGHVDQLLNVPTDQIIYVFEGQSTDGEIYVDDEVEIVERKITTATTNLKNIGVSIFPNPGSDQFTISADETMTTIEIFNSAGMGIDQYKVNGKIFSGSTSLYDPGIYIIKVRYKDRSVGYLKWMKL